MDKQQSIMFATKFTEDLLTFYGLNLVVLAECDEDVIELKIPSSEANGILIGKNAETIRALQTMISNVLRIKDAEVYRVNLDVADYKKRHNDKILEKAERWIEKVRQTGEDYIVNLNAADRRLVHKLADDYSTIKTHSVGEGRERRLIISKVEQE